jgi:hypothetical protein
MFIDIYILFKFETVLIIRMVFKPKEGG